MFLYIKKLSSEYSLLLEKRYGFKNFEEDNIIECLDLIGKKRGCLIRGGEVDYDKVYQVVLRDLRDGLVGNVTFD